MVEETKTTSTGKKVVMPKKKEEKEETTEASKEVFGSHSPDSVERTAASDTEDSYLYYPKDMVKGIFWEVIGSKHCLYTKKAVELLVNHQESHKISYIEDDRRAYQEICSRNMFYVPVIFQNAKHFGSYADLENYYKKNFIPNDWNKIHK